MSDKPTILPPNAGAGERAIEQAQARLEDVPVPHRDLWDPDTCPPELLPYLAYTYSVDRWDSAWPVETRRQAIRDSIAVHRVKGTVGALKRAIGALGFDAEFQEWWQTSGAGLDPHEFRAVIETHGLGLTLAQARAVAQIIDSTKPLRSHMAEISYAALVPPALAYVGSVPFDGSYSYTVAEVGELPLPGIPDGSLALVGSTAPYSIWQYKADIEEWFALLVYADAEVDLPTDARVGAMALVGTETLLEDREAFVRTGSGWEPLTPDVWATYATVGALPVTAEPNQVVGVGTTAPYELHQYEGGFWLPRTAYRASVGALPGDAPAGALALVGSAVTLSDRTPYVGDGTTWQLAGPPSSLTYALVADLPSSGAKTGSTGLVGSMPTQEVHVRGASSWEPRLLHRSTPGALPGTAPDGALALVGSAVALEARVPYVRATGAWRRVGVPMIWDITGYDDFSQPHLREGDYGLLPGAHSLVRYRAALPVDAGAGGGTVQAWISLAAYASGTASLVGWFVGTEPSAGLASALVPQGLAYTGTGSITSDGTAVSLSAAGNQSAVLQALLGAVVAGTRVEVQGLVQVQLATGTGGNAHITVSDGVQVSYHTQNNVSGGGGGAMVRGNATAANATSANAYRDNSATALPTLAQPPEWVQIVDEGSTVACTLVRAGRPEVQLTRASVPANFGQRAYLSASSAAGATGTTILRVSRYRVIRFT